MDEKELVIDIKELKKSFGDTEVLKGIDLELHKGENLVILGKSGAGKSVLIKCIVKLEEPSEGELKVFDEDILTLRKEQELNEYRRRVGFLFQGGALYDAMTVEENLRFPLDRLPDKLTEEEIQERIDEALENVGLEDTRKKMPSELSGGMRKRIALARTLILRPEIMLYDEPTTGLDPSTSKEISHLILEMQQKYEMSSIIITHDMKCAQITANRMKVVKEGRFAYEGSFEELQSEDDPWLKDFFD
ncbi:ABC transporter ATP-binding protein [Fulvivirga ligni]|uniref:ABC transporter ATP-binding protein n=1 Tax=Fulvivirga ligni TaxID=2904246 RepID=UPI001F3DE443|nr:ATP-binding cassette domain-containing protein [Fulvivirga ligni]UII19742.1 ATP-binding cassette domain-containing protein [Fulvivirga ligni]